LKLASLFSRPSRQIVKDSKVLVCSIDPELGELLESDSAVCSRHYRRVDTGLLSGIAELLRAIEGGYDIVHLFVRLSPTDPETPLLPSELIQKCCDGNVKLLWIASENNPDDYIKGFRVAGKSLNLIMTISRNGTKFAGFLEKLLSGVSGGETLPVAWAVLVPQGEGSWQQELPSCIFYAGRGDVKLLP
jgi:hypothetical protein